MKNRNVVKKRYLNSIYRIKANSKTRENYLRLDKNEKTTNFHKNIILYYPLTKERLKEINNTLFL